MVSLAELAELAVLVAMSVVLVVRVIFRPTAMAREKTRSASVARQAIALDVLGPAPSRAATHTYGRLLRDARRAGLIIDWKRARIEQEAMAPRTTLVSAARRQIGRRAEPALSSTAKH